MRFKDANPITKQKPTGGKRGPKQRLFITFDIYNLDYGIWLECKARYNRQNYGYVISKIFSNPHTRNINIYG